MYIHCISQYYVLLMYISKHSTLLLKYTFAHTTHTLTFQASTSNALVSHSTNSYPTSSHHHPTTPHSHQQTDGEVYTFSQKTLKIGGKFTRDHPTCEKEKYFTRLSQRHVT